MRPLALIFALSLLPGAALAQEDAEQPRPAKLVLKATGIGKPPAGAKGPIAKLRAKRAARVVAMRNLAAAIHGMIQDKDATWVQGAVRGFEVVEEKELDGGGWRVTIELPVAELVLQLNGQHARAAELAKALEASKARVAELQARVAELKAAKAALVARVKTLVAALGEHVDGMRKLLEQATEGLGK